MRISHYFEEPEFRLQRTSWKTCRPDSEGKNVFARATLKEKRSQFAALMSMIDFAPEMVAPAFHGGISFINPHAMTLLSIQPSRTSFPHGTGSKMPLKRIRTLGGRPCCHCIMRSGR